MSVSSAILLLMRLSTERLAHSPNGELLVLEKGEGMHLARHYQKKLLIQRGAWMRLEGW